MANFAPVFILGLSATLLAGCASTGGGGGGTPSPALFAATAGTASKALADGETLMAYNSLMSASVEHDYDESETRATSAKDFSISANDAGGLDVSIDGVTHSFTAADIDQGMLEFEAPGGSGPYYRLNSWGGDIVDILEVSNGAHHQTWSYFWDPGEGLSYTGFGVVGTETMPSALVGKANATYSGFAGAALSDVNAQNDTTWIAGDLSMSADFNAGQVSGTVDNIEVLGGAGIPGTVALNSAPISGNGFQGTITPDTALQTAVGTSNLSGTYGGKFFGPDGREVGGVMSITGDDTVGTGVFSGTQN